MRISDWSSDVCSSDLHDAQRLVDAHEVGEARLAVAPESARPPRLPAPITAQRQVEQRRRLLVGQPPEAEEVDRGAENRRRLGVGNRRRAEIPGRGVDRPQLRHGFSVMALNRIITAKWHKKRITAVNQGNYAAQQGFYT